MSEFKLKTRLALALAAIAVLAHGAGAATAGTLYTNNYSSKQVAAFSIGAGGLLTPLAGSPFAAPYYAEEIAITPDGRTMVQSYGFFLDRQIGSFSISADGSPTPIGAIPAAIYGNPAITPDGRFAYLPGAVAGVVGFAIGAAGDLTEVGSFGSFGSEEMVAIAPDGRFLFLPSFAGGTIERYEIQNDGTLAPLGPAPVGLFHPVSMQITTDGAFAVALGIGGAPEVRLQALAVGADGSLTPLGPSTIPTDTTPSAPVISPDGRFVYVADGNNDTITAFSLGAGGLSQIGAPVAAGFEDPEAVGMSVDGRYLYATFNGSEVIQAFSVGADGTLTKIGGPAPTGGESDGSALIARPAVPTARLAPPPPVTPGKKVSLDAGASSDVGAAIASYAWDFGDGTALPAGGATTDHVFKPGVYEVKVTVNDDAGCTGFVFTGQSAFCNGREATATATIDTLPVVQSLRVAPARFAGASASKKRKKKRGSTIRYKLSEKAKVAFTLQGKSPGRKLGKKCKRKTKANAGKRKCTRFRTVGKLSARGKAGKNARRLPAKLKGKRLKPGPYRLTAVAIDSAGGKSATKRTGFKVKKTR